MRAVLLLGIVLITFFTNYVFGQNSDKAFWEDPLINGDNREIMRAFINPKANRLLSLNGEW